MSSGNCVWWRNNSTLPQLGTTARDAVACTSPSDVQVIWQLPGGAYAPRDRRRVAPHMRLEGAKMAELHYMEMGWSGSGWMDPLPSERTPSPSPASSSPSFDFDEPSPRRGESTGGTRTSRPRKKSSSRSAKRGSKKSARKGAKKSARRSAKRAGARSAKRGGRKSASRSSRAGGRKSASRKSAARKGGSRSASRRRTKKGGSRRRR
jgi:hypothetical protein